MNITPFILLVLFGFKTAMAASALQVTSESYESGGRRIAVDRFRPDAKSRGALLVLHGAGGMLVDGPTMRRMARSLAEAGFDVSVVHYFNRTGTIVALDSTMQRNFAVWLETVCDGVQYAHTRSGNDAPVGIYGYSLGAFLSVVAASDNRLVGAVVEHSGGVWNNQMERIGRMPPVLMVHGRLDSRVPFEKYAEPLLTLLRKRGGIVQTRFFAHEGHGFTPAALGEVSAAATAFFSHQLGGSKVSLRAQSASSTR